MVEKKTIISQIKRIVKSIDPDAEIILYGSYARETNSESSDIDILILIEKDEIKYQDEKIFKYPLYDLEFETGLIISPIIITKKAWEGKHKITQFYENVNSEGICL